MGLWIEVIATLECLYLCGTKELKKCQSELVYGGPFCNEL